MNQYMLLDNAANVYASATAYNFGSWSRILTLKCNTNGSLLWSNSFGCDTAANYIYGMSLDNSGNVFVSGNWDNNAIISQMSTAKYNTDGIELWRRTFNYGSGSWATAQSQALDKYGNIYITGWANKPNQTSTTTTIKYSSSGAFQWDIQHIANESNWSFLVLPDSLNDVYIAGYKNNNATNADYLLIKYSQLTGINTLSENIPKAFSLYQNFPNPFNPSTVIKFDLLEEGSVAIRIYDIAGKEVYSETGYKKAGTFEFKFDGTNLASGMYFYRIQSSSFSDTKKMVLIK